MHSVRIAVAEDEELVRQLMDELHSTPAVDPEFSEQFARLIHSSRSDVIVAEDETGVIGVAIVDLLDKLSLVECRINEVIISSSARGKGYGAQLITYCEKWAWKHGADFIEMTSRPGRVAANALYKNLDFELRETNVYKKCNPGDSVNHGSH